MNWNVSQGLISRAAAAADDDDEGSLIRPMLNTRQRMGRVAVRITRETPREGKSFEGVLCNNMLYVVDQYLPVFLFVSYCALVLG
jgi:hypothetical protein